MEARPTPAPALMPLAEARERLVRALGAPDTERLSLTDAIGRVLAEDVVAHRAVPAEDRALLDGWAVAAADTVGASPYAPAFLSGPLPVAAGDALPPGCDAVLAPVSGRADGGLLVVEAALAPGENLHRAGFDLRSGATICARGSVFDVLARTLAEEADIETVTVARLPVAVIADRPPLAACAVAVIRATGATIAEGGEPARLTLRIVDDAPAGAVPGLALTGAEATILATATGIPVLVVPDRTAALATVLEALVLPALATALGRPDGRPRETRPLARKLASRVGFGELALLDVDAEGRWLPLVVGDLSAAAWSRARAVVELPPESEGLPEETVLAAPRPFVRP